MTARVATISARPPLPASVPRSRRWAPRRAMPRMKVLVLGAGVIGVTAAYELAGAGHEVTVVDRQAGAGARDQLRQRRRGLARLLGALGRARACR